MWQQQDYEHQRLSLSGQTVVAAARKTRPHHSIVFSFDIIFYLPERDQRFFFEKREIHHEVFCCLSRTISGNSQCLCVSHKDGLEIVEVIDGSLLTSCQPSIFHSGQHNESTMLPLWHSFKALMCRPSICRQLLSRRPLPMEQPNPHQTLP